jgi:hypothetical protein
MKLMQTLQSLIKYGGIIGWNSLINLVVKIMCFSNDIQINQV